MSPGRTLGLAALTVLELDPVEQVRCAATTGYDWVSVRLVPATAREPHRDTVGDTALVRETRLCSDDLGVPVLDVETLRLTPETDVVDLEVHLATGAQLGARTVVVAGIDPDRSRLVDNYHRLAELAQRFGLTVNLEFMPWTAVPGVVDAAEVLAAVDHPAAGVAVDSFHFDRSGSTLDQLAALPERWRRMMHLCDAPAERPTTTEGLLHQARRARMVPGTGKLDLTGQLQHMAPDAPILLEVPLEAAGAAPPAIRAAEVLEGARDVLGRTQR